MDGGKVHTSSQISAAVIVLGGTIGAVDDYDSPFSADAEPESSWEAFFFRRRKSVADKVDEIIGFATTARKNGIVSLESQASSIEEPVSQEGAGPRRRWHRARQNPGTSWSLRSSSSKQDAEAEAKGF